MPASDDRADSMENKGDSEQNPSKDSARGVDDMMHRMSDPNDFEGRGVDIHVTTVLRADCIECPDYFHHIPFVFEIPEKTYFRNEISRDPDGMASVVTVELCPFLDISPHIGIIVQMNPRHFSAAHGFT